MAADEDSIADRAERVHRTLEGADDPRAVQVAVGGPCPACGERVEIVVHPDSTGFTCGSCGGRFSVTS
jgi:hypothetical protein